MPVDLPLPYRREEDRSGPTFGVVLILVLGVTIAIHALFGAPASLAGLAQTMM